MQSLSDLSTAEFRAALTPERVKIGMIIQAVLAGGASIFFIAVSAIGLFNQPKNPANIDYDMLSTMTIACMVFWLIVYITGIFLYNSFFKPERLQAAFSSDLFSKNGAPISATPAEKAVSLIGPAMLIRTALLEGAAFFGLASLTIGAQQGALKTVPWIWIDALPWGVLLVWVIISFPTSSRLEKIFETKIIRH